MLEVAFVLLLLLFMLLPQPELRGELCMAVNGPLRGHL
jgi:hypothetical protein